MTDGQLAHTLSAERADTRARIPALGRAYAPPARPYAPGVGTFLRSDPISPELGAFLTHQLTAARADDAESAAAQTAATLATLLASSKPWPVDLALALLLRVAGLLDAADAGGIVLGTFTPSCVVLSGRYLVLAGPDARAGVDPAYVAPEQLRRGAPVDGRASRYGFAHVAASLLGDEPRSRGLLGALRGRRARPGTLSRGCARAAQRVILAARDPDPDCRFRTASAFISALGAACGAWPAEPVTVAVVTAAAARGAAARRAASTVGVVGVAALAGALGWYAARRPVVIPPELENDIAIGRVVTDTAHGSVAPDLGAPAALEQYGYRLLMATAPGRDSASLAAPNATAAAGALQGASLDTTSLPTFATAIALPRVEPAGDAPRLVTTTSTEFAAAGVAETLLHTLRGADGGRDVEPALLRDGEGPAYPADLLLTRVQGDVVARFTIDSAGRVDPGTFQVVRSSHSAFTNSVRGALGQLRYRPAERGGRRVSASVEQRFQFDLPHAPRPR